MINILVEKIHPNAKLPKLATKGSAAADLYAVSDEMIAPNTRKLIPLGFKVEIPEGYEMQIRPRSGLALAHGISVLNSPGTVDSDYRNEVGVIIINTSDTDYIIHAGDRIAQAKISAVPEIEYIEGVVNNTDRKGGFGSTGK